jgi:hypothetical protein
MLRLCNQIGRAAESVAFSAKFSPPGDERKRSTKHPTSTKPQNLSTKESPSSNIQNLSSGDFGIW